MTLSLPVSLIRKAKSVAAEQDKSLNEFIRAAVEARLREETGYARAKKRQLEYLRKGFDLGTEGVLKVSREEIHER